MVGVKATARVLAENPEALDMWMTWAAAVLYQVRRELGLDERREDGEERPLRIVRP